MKTLNLIGAALALVLVPSSALAAADCEDMTCCKEGKGDCCEDMKKSDDHAGRADYDMSGPKK